MVDESDEKGDIFLLRPEFFFSDWELENKLHLCFLNFFVCLFRLSLCGKDFASFAFIASFSTGSLCGSPAFIAQKMKFPLGISSVIAAKSVVSCDASYFPH